MTNFRSATYIKQALADRDWWQAFGDRLGWQLYGFDYRDVATFRLRSQRHVEIVREVKEDIERTWRRTGDDGEPAR